MKGVCLQSSQNYFIPVQDKDSIFRFGEMLKMSIPEVLLYNNNFIRINLGWTSGFYVP